MSDSAPTSRSAGVRGYAASDPTLTDDTFVAEVAIQPNRCILVYLRKHGGRQFVRWRVFHRHRRGYWYPDRRRAFVIPVGVAQALAHAIAAAPAGQFMTPKPPWLIAIDQYREHRLRCLADLSAPPNVIETELRRKHRGPA